MKYSVGDKVDTLNLKSKNYAFLVKDIKSLNYLKSLLQSSMSNTEFNKLKRVTSLIETQLSIYNPCWLYITNGWSLGDIGMDSFSVINNPNDCYDIKFVIIDLVHYVRKLKLEKLNEI